MLQHFHGLKEIDRPVFDDSTAILMDLVTKATACISSICFLENPCACGINHLQPSTHAETYYVDAIHTYLMEHHHAKVTKVHHEEKGIIPMGPLFHDPSIPGLGPTQGPFARPVVTPSCSFRSKLSVPSTT